MTTPTTSALPFWKGKDSKIIFYLDDKTLTLDVTDWEVKAEGEKVQEPICGEDRDRLDFVITHYSITINTKQQKVDTLKAFIGHQAQVDSRALPKNSAVGFAVYPNDGTKATFEAREYSLDDWTLGVGGRADRNKLSIPGRARYFDPVGG